MNQVDQSATLQPMIEMNNLKKYFYISSGFVEKEAGCPGCGWYHAEDRERRNCRFCWESGSGKTTLARLVLNLIRPTEVL